MARKIFQFIILVSLAVEWREWRRGLAHLSNSEPSLSIKISLLLLTYLIIAGRNGQSTFFSFKMFRINILQTILKFSS